MNSERLPSPVPEVIFQNMTDGAVLLLPSDEIYFGLNEVGALIWSWLPPECQGIRELCDRLCEKFPDVPRGTIEQDVRELLDELLAQGLVASNAAPVTADRDSAPKGS
jgi:hypothetical protein